MTLSKKSPMPVTEDSLHKITNRMEDCISVYSKLNKSRRLKNPLSEQIESGLSIIEVERSIFKKDKQLMRWINKTCPKTVRQCLRIALTNFYNNPFDKNIKVSLV